MTQPHYSPMMLSHLIWQTENIKDHQKLVNLYEALHEQHDIDFDEGLKKEISRPAHYFRLIHGTETMEELCEYCLILQHLQEEGYAVITGRLKSRIDFQRKIIKAKNHNHGNK